MKKDRWADYPFSFHDSDELGPAILARISKKRGLQTARPLTGSWAEPALFTIGDIASPRTAGMLRLT
jgi:hypothetical protein